MAATRATAERLLGALPGKLDAAGAPDGLVRLAASAPRHGYELLSSQGREIARTRRRLARQFLAGDGYEVGALNLPMWMPPGARVRYVDRKPIEGLRAEYPEWGAWDIVAPDVVTDGETLEGIADASADFIVANHFIEHTEDPIGTFGHHLRVLKPGGIGFYAVPDKRHTFDRQRPVTDVEHLLADHREGPERSRTQHYREWVEQVAEAAADDPAALEAERASIHFHVFTPDSFAALLVHGARSAGLALQIEAIQPVRQEFIAIVRKSG
jgi:predicted SAM-dependent methyltransferase